MVRRDSVVEVFGLAGGKGPAYVHHIVSQKELMGHGRMYAKVILPPGSSVGWHQHVNETEPYYILKGEADFIDTDRKVTRVKAGDVCVIRPGDFHSLENNSGADVEFMALVYNADEYLYDENDRLTKVRG